MSFRLGRARLGHARLAWTLDEIIEEVNGSDGVTSSDGAAVLELAPAPEPVIAGDKATLYEEIAVGDVVIAQDLASVTEALGTLDTVVISEAATLSEFVMPTSPFHGVMTRIGTGASLSTATGPSAGVRRAGVQAHLDQ